MNVLASILRIYIVIASIIRIILGFVVISTMCRQNGFSKFVDDPLLDKSTPISNYPQFPQDPFQPKPVDPKRAYEVILTLLVITMILFIILNIMSLLGAAMPNPLILTVHQFCLVLLPIFVTYLMWVYTYPESQTRLHKSFKYYYFDPDSREEVDAFQREMKCCGISKINEFPTKLPESCCDYLTYPCVQETKYQPFCDVKEEILLPLVHDEEFVYGLSWSIIAFGILELIFASVLKYQLDKPPEQDPLGELN